MNLFVCVSMHPHYSKIVYIVVVSIIAFLSISVGGTKRAFKIDTEKMPLGRLSKRHLQSAYSVLTEMQKASFWLIAVLICFAKRSAEIPI